MHTIENDLLRVQIDPVGAELASVFKKSTQQEYMWQGDPNIWGSQAPVLFPIIGGLKEGTYFFNDTAYQLPKHGFIRYNQGLKVDQQSPTKVSFSLESNTETLTMYPFRFYFEVAFELIEIRFRYLMWLKIWILNGYILVWAGIRHLIALCTPTKTMKSITSL